MRIIGFGVRAEDKGEVVILNLQGVDIITLRLGRARGPVEEL